MYRTLTFIAVLMLALVACGNSTPSATISSTTLATTSSTAPAAMTTTTLPTVRSTAPAAITTTTLVTASSTASAVTSSTSTAVAAQASIYSGLTQSTTAEGYYMLGKVDAPVVMTLYSDLL